MRGIIVNFHIAYTNEVFIKVQGITTKKEAMCLIDKQVCWKDGRKKFIGNIVGVHGTGGTMKAKFDKPLPAKCLAKMIEII